MTDIPPNSNSNGYNLPPPSKAKKNDNINGISRKELSDDLDISQFEFHSKNCCDSSVLRKGLSIAYDIFSVIVSLLDIITDIIVLVEFYSLGRMVFFYISLTILIIAQLSYTSAFWWRFMDSHDNNDSSCAVVCAFFFLLAISPILSYLFYFTPNKDAPLFEFFENLFEHFKCDFDYCCSSNASATVHVKETETNSKKEALRNWVESNLMKHLGFIIEALIEAFPQSILQLIAIVYYNDTRNYISILSILLSMISVSTKSFILSVKVSYNWKSAIYNWISVLIDFISIFCIVSFIFYEPNLTDNVINPFQVLQQIWMCSTLITVGVSVIGCTSFYLAIIVGHVYDKGCVGYCALGFFIFTILWIISLPLISMLMIITNFVLFAMILKSLGTKSDSIPFYVSLLSFVNNAKQININDYFQDVPLIISSNQHKTIRICCINRVLFESSKDYINANIYDKKLHLYLKKKSVITYDADFPYSTATLNGIKQHSTKEKNNGGIIKYYKQITQFEKITDFFQDIYLSKNFQSVRCLYAFLFFICLPIYLLGRCWNTFFILFMVCYLSIGYNINVFTDIPLFQTAMVVIYLCLVVIWIILLLSILKEQYYLSFILPGSKHLTSPNCNDKVVKDITKYYHSVISRLVTQRYCIKLFGKDITIIIMQLWGNEYTFTETEIDL